MAKKGTDLAAILGALDDEPEDKSRELNSAIPVQAALKVVPVGVLVTPEDRQRLRQLALDSGSSIQKLGHEAFNLMLQKRGLPPLEPVTANVPSGRRRT